MEIYSKIHNYLYTGAMARLLGETPKQNTFASGGGVFVPEISIVVEI